MMKCPLCGKNDKFEVGYCIGVNPWLWFGCDRCGLYKAADNIKDLIKEFNSTKQKEWLLKLAIL